MAVLLTLPRQLIYCRKEIGGLQFFYKQLLTGDMTDNIRGLYGVGKGSALLKKLDSMDTEQDMFLHVKEQYVKRFGNYAEQFMFENGTLLWMLRSKEEMWEFPTIIETKEDNALLDQINFFTRIWYQMERVCKDRLFSRYSSNHYCARGSFSTISCK